MREELHPNFNTWKTRVSNSSARPNSAGNAFPWPHSFLLFLQSFYCLRSDVHPITGPTRPLLQLQALRLGLCLIFILLLRAFLSRFFSWEVLVCFFFLKKEKDQKVQRIPINHVTHSLVPMPWCSTVNLLNLISGIDTWLLRQVCSLHDSPHFICATGVTACVYN